MLRIVCVQVGNYAGDGAGYVNSLYDQVRRNLAEGFEATFECFTDDPAGLLPGIVARPVRADLREKGWWAKLGLFEAGLWPDGDRILYFDLDTVITGRLDEIAAYRGGFAMLRDFYRPEGFGSGVMAWEAGRDGNIWLSWLEAGRPEWAGGDQAWIEFIASKVEALQDLFPGAFVSYKADCRQGVPRNAKVVCFHGHPRPHDAPEEWVRETRKIGGWSAPDFDTICSVNRDRRIANVCSALARKLPNLKRRYAEPPDGRRLIIVGGGPSARQLIEDIRDAYVAGTPIWALNGAARWLIEQGIPVDAQVLADGRAENLTLVDRDAARHYVSSICDPAVLDQLTGRNIVLFHVANVDIEKALADQGEMEILGGGSTVGMQALIIAWMRGYRDLVLYGFDSSYHEGEHHAYPQPLNDADKAIAAHVDGKVFMAAPWMVVQANEFQTVATELANAGCTITVKGAGLLPYVAHRMMLNQLAAEASAIVQKAS